MSERVLGEPASIEQLGALADVVRALDADGIQGCADFELLAELRGGGAV